MSANHSATALRRPFAATTRSAASSVPSPSRTPVTTGTSPKSRGIRSPSVRIPRFFGWGGGEGRGGEEGGGGDAGAQGHSPFGEGGAAQDPFEGRAAAGDHHQLVVARLRCELHLRRQAVAEAHLGRALGEERLEDVGLVVGEQVAQAGEEGVAVADLRRAAAIPLERLVGGGGHRRVVAFDDRHVVPGPAELQRAGEAGDAATDHDDLHQRNSSPANSPEVRQASMYWK